MKAGDVVELAGISYRQLDHWTTKGFLLALHDGGSGKDRDYSDETAMFAVVMGELVRDGFTPDVAAILAPDLRNYGYAHLGHYLIVPVKT